jgi:tetratricopeptide (TPR) repeat protein
MSKLALLISLAVLLSGAAVRSGEAPEGLRLLKQINQQMNEKAFDEALKTAELALAANRKEYAAAVAAQDAKEANGACMRVAAVLGARGLLKKLSGGTVEDLDKAYAEASGEVSKHCKDPQVLAAFQMMLFPGYVSTYVELDEYARAEPYSLKLVEAVTLAKGKTSLEYASMSVQHGMILNEQGKAADADPYLTAALTILEKAPDVKPGRVIHASLLLGVVKNARKQFAQAEVILTKALARAEAAGDQKGIAALEETLATSLESQGKKAEAEKHRQRSQAIQAEQKKAGQ